MEEDITILEERITMLKRHIKYYEESDCKTDIYHQLVKECKALENLLTKYKQQQKVINEMATYIIRNVSREKIERLTELKDKEVIWSYDIKEYFTNKVEREGK